MGEKRRRALSRKYDAPLMVITSLLLIAGVVLVFSASWPEGISKHDNGYFFITKHIKNLILGLIAMVFCMKFDYRYYKKLDKLIIAVALFSYALLFTRFGDSRLGSSRWVQLPGFSFMPSDIMKVAAVFALANLLSGNRKYKKDFTKGTLPIIIYIAIPVGLIVIKDFGSAAVLGISLMVMAIIDGLNLAHLVPMAGFFSLLVAFALNSERFGYRIKRLNVFLDPFSDLSDKGWQLGNSLLSLALGGVKGVGLGKGMHKYTYIPHVYNDFIFSVAGEEFGFIGATSIIVLFLAFVQRGFTIGLKCKDKYGKLVAIGLTTMIAIQAFLNIMVSIGAAPVTGITLPFISYGGTSLIINMACAGVLLNISKNNK